MPTADEQQTGARFDLLAESYDNDPRYPVRTMVRGLVTDHLKSFGQGRVLDVGCGTGAMLIEAAPHIASGIGLDVSAASLRVAEENTKRAGRTNLSFTNGGFSDLDDTDFVGAPPFDIVTSVYALHHLSPTERAAAIAQFAHRLEEGGKVVIGDLIFFDDPDRHRHDFGAVGYDPTYDQPASSDTLMAEFKDAGLHLIEAESVHPLAGVLIGVKQ